MVAVYSENHTKPINILWANCSYCMLKQVVYVLNSLLSRVNKHTLGNTKKYQNAAHTYQPV
jgi:hypothetical protein